MKTVQRIIFIAYFPLESRKTVNQKPESKPFQRLSWDFQLGKRRNVGAYLGAALKATSKEKKTSPIEFKKFGTFQNYNDRHERETLGIEHVPQPQSVRASKQARTFGILLLAAQRSTR